MARIRVSQFLLDSSVWKNSRFFPFSKRENSTTSQFSRASAEALSTICVPLCEFSDQSEEEEEKAGGEEWCKKNFNFSEGEGSAPETVLDVPRDNTHTLTYITLFIWGDFIASQPLRTRNARSNSEVNYKYQFSDRSIRWRCRTDRRIAPFRFCTCFEYLAICVQHFTAPVWNGWS